MVSIMVVASKNGGVTMVLVYVSRSLKEGGWYRVFIGDGQGFK